jgi:hypothetical protein
MQYIIKHEATFLHDAMAFDNIEAAITWFQERLIDDFDEVKQWQLFELGREIELEFVPAQIKMVNL